MDGDKPKPPTKLAAAAVDAAKDAYLARAHSQSWTTVAAAILFDDLSNAVRLGEMRGRTRKRHELRELVGARNHHFVEALSGRLRNFVAYRLATDAESLQVVIKGPTAADRGDDARSELYLTVEIRRDAVLPNRGAASTDAANSPVSMPRFR